MILEELDGGVKVLLNGKNIAIGDSIEDTDFPLISVIGKGKAIFRADPSTTLEAKGAELVVEEWLANNPSPTPVVEAAPAAVVAPSVETTSEPTKEA